MLAMQPSICRRHGNLPSFKADVRRRDWSAPWRRLLGVVQLEPTTAQWRMSIATLAVAAAPLDALAIPL